MVKRINLNADMGEGFGAYDIGNDEGLMQIIKSANIACGFHAGDPDVMHRNILAAKALGVSIGAHPGFPYRGIWPRPCICPAASTPEPACPKAPSPLPPA